MKNNSNGQETDSGPDNVTDIGYSSVDHWREKAKRAGANAGKAIGAVALGAAVAVGMVAHKNHEGNEQRAAAQAAAEQSEKEEAEARVQLTIQGVEQLSMALESGQAEALIYPADSAGISRVVEQGLRDFNSRNDGDHIYYAPSDEVVLALSDIAKYGINSDEWQENARQRIEEDRLRKLQPGEKLVGLIVLPEDEASGGTAITGLNSAIHGLLRANQIRTDVPIGDPDITTRMNVGDGDLTSLVPGK